jgi:hypothetical protein
LSFARYAMFSQMISSSGSVEGGGAGAPYRCWSLSTSLENVMVGLPCSLRVAVVGRVIIILIFFFFAAFVFLLVFFLVWLLSEEYIGSYRPIRRVRVGTFWMYAAHAKWYAL